MRVIVRRDSCLTKASGRAVRASRAKSTTTALRSRSRAHSLLRRSFRRERTSGVATFMCRHVCPDAESGVPHASGVHFASARLPTLNAWSAAASAATTATTAAAITASEARHVGKRKRDNEQGVSRVQRVECAPSSSNRSALAAVLAVRACANIQLLPSRARETRSPTAVLSAGR